MARFAYFNRIKKSIINSESDANLSRSVSDPRIPAADGVWSYLETKAVWHQLAKLISTKKPWILSGVDLSAAGFVAGMVLRILGKRICFLCENARGVEEFAADLSIWSPGGRMFPDLDVRPEDPILPDPEVVSERLELLNGLANGEGPQWLAIVADQRAGLVPSSEAFHQKKVEVRVGVKVSAEQLISVMEEWGYERVPQVYTRGQFSSRGGILDVYSWQHRLPVRIEFFDEEPESIREFDLEKQVSVKKIEACEILPVQVQDGQVELSRYLSDYLMIAVGDAASEEVLCRISANVVSTNVSDSTEAESALYGHAEQMIVGGEGLTFEAGDLVLHESKRAALLAELKEWIGKRWKIVCFCNNEGEWQRFVELIGQGGLDASSILYREGDLGRGFVWSNAKLAILTDAQLFGRSVHQRIRRLAHRRERLMASRGVSDFSEFVEGDYVVHTDHGIGRYLGICKLPSDRGQSEVMALEFANEAKLYVPLEQAAQISRYVGVGKRHPALSELGDPQWEKAKQKAQRSIFEYAKRMLHLQAERDTQLGVAFPPDSHWQEEFEQSFVFRATQDQLRAIAETKADMESRRPMDRLICGDVGFGKTEVAIRACFKAVMGGKQVAFLVPTTVLAQQHYETLRERMSDYPVRIELLSRYRTRAEQMKVIKLLQEGGVDVVVGTHRIVSADVEFKNLGLLIVDEEQRFGVKHKEKLKERFRLVDVLTLSATPIPRTLYMALMGARDMSLIETPPPNRQPVETVICAYDERIMRDAIQRELDRGGQVYLLHNRVRTIEALAKRVRDLCPKARVDIGHGQMDEKELEDVMARFVRGQTDVLVSTTIIESGLDIPNANTIIIDRADLFGLADLYQLRGRVGRSGVKAYAYLMLPRSLMTVGEARKRISAIKQYTGLGVGFKVAMRDLELRGAGNILGTAQSGHIISIGFELYCRLLRQVVGVLRGEKVGPSRVAGVSFDFISTNEGEFVAAENTRAPAFLPAAFISDTAQRLAAYRRLNEAITEDAVLELAQEWRDRYGHLPDAVQYLIWLTRIRLLASSKGFSMVEVKENKLMLTRRGDYLLINKKFPRLTATDTASRLLEVYNFINEV